MQNGIRHVGAVPGVSLKMPLTGFVLSKGGYLTHIMQQCSPTKGKLPGHMGYNMGGVGVDIVGVVWRPLIKLGLLPLMVGFSYECIKLCGKHDNAFTRIISKPGMWMQLITTNEPDDSQIEVAITSLQAVLPENKEDDKW